MTSFVVPVNSHKLQLFLFLCLTEVRSGLPSGFLIIYVLYTVPLERVINIIGNVTMLPTTFDRQGTTSNLETKLSEDLALSLSNTFVCFLLGKCYFTNTVNKYDLFSIQSRLKYPIRKKYITNLHS